MDTYVYITLYIWIQSVIDFHLQIQHINKFWLQGVTAVGRFSLFNMSEFEKLMKLLFVK